MASFGFRRILEGLRLVPRTTLTLDEKGDFQVLDSDGKPYYHNGTSNSPLITASSTDTLTNKTLTSPTINGGTITGATILPPSGLTITDTDFTLQDNGDATKQLQFNASGITTGNTRILSAPDATTTIVGTDATQTLTNKTLTDSTTFFQDEADNTKKLQLQLSGITTSTTRTLTAPDANTVIVGTDATQSLTNKTISGSTNTITVSDNKFTIQDNADATKQVVFEASGITTGNTRTLIVPDASTTIVGTDTTQTLSNKSLVDNSTIIVDNSDSTKQIKFDAGGTTGTSTTITGAQTANRVLTLPNATDTLTANAATQTLSNKTLTAPVIDIEVMTQQGSTPATPSAGSSKIYVKTDGNPYILSPAGIETPIGTATGGSKNYLTVYKGNPGNGNFELNATTGWSLFNTAMTGVIPTGSISAGAASITTFNTVSSGQLALNYSLQTASSGAISAGQGFITDAFTIDIEDQAKVITFSFYYSTISGASNINFSGTSSNTFAIYAYDVTNSLWIQPAGVYNLTQSSGVGRANGSFQSSSNGTQYRFAVLAVNASAGAATLYWDDFSVGPTAIVNGFNTASPTAAGVVQAYGGTTAPTGWLLCDGTSLLRSQYTDLFTNIGTAYGTIDSDHFNIPDLRGYFLRGVSGSSNTDPDKTSRTPSATGGSTGNNVGSVQQSAFASHTHTKSMGPNASNNSNNPLSSDATAPNRTMTTDATGGNETRPVNVYVNYIIKLYNDQTVTLSNDTDTRVVAARASNSTTTLSNGNNTTVIYPTVAFDTHSAYDSTTGIYTVPVSGKYRMYFSYFDAAARTASGPTSSQTWSFQRTRSAVTVTQGIRVFQAKNASVAYNPDTSGECLIDCFAGDQIFMNWANAWGTTLDQDGTARCYIEFERISGPATIAANETVACSYYSSNQPTIVSSATIKYENKIFDTHNAYNTSTGIYTVPISGTYRASACLQTNSAAWNSGDAMEITISPSVGTSCDYRVIAPGATITNCVGATDIFHFNAGDTLQISLSNGRTGGSVSLVATTSRNKFAVERIGN